MEVEGCGYDGKQACAPSIKEMAIWEKHQCDAGNTMYYSYAEEHPGKTLTFTLGSIVGVTAVYTVITEGVVTAAIDRVVYKLGVKLLQK